MVTNGENNTHMVMMPKKEDWKMIYGIQSLYFPLLNVLIRMKIVKICLGVFI